MLDFLRISFSSALHVALDTSYTLKLQNLTKGNQANYNKPQNIQENRWEKGSLSHAMISELFHFRIVLVEKTKYS